MALKFPEISVAPGEGQVPMSMLYDKDWDVKAFPHLHNMDGSNGKDEQRQVILTDQRYFMQRILNKEGRFSKDPSYLFAAVGYLEERQIYRNISLVGLRGKKTQNEHGNITYQLDDEYRVLESIPNSPAYWKVRKYEFLAKLDNFGPFQIFFTLSCADLRWDANFAALLLERGYSISITMEFIDNRYQLCYEAKVENGEWKPLQRFIQEDVEESHHELIRRNVVTATRYFHQRVKMFFGKIVMAKSNPMNVKYYSSKVEFQSRGAGHIHGTLWLNFQKLSKLVECNTTNRLRNPKATDEKNVSRPLRNIAATFKKLRNQQELDQSDINALTVIANELSNLSRPVPRGIKRM